MGECEQPDVRLIWRLPGRLCGLLRIAILLRVSVLPTV